MTRATGRSRQLSPGKGHPGKRQAQAVGIPAAGKRWGVVGVWFLSLWLLLAAQAIALSPGEALAVITVHPEPVVSGDRVRLGDIATVESPDAALKEALENLEVGRAPLPGQVRWINEARLRVLLRRDRLPESRILIRGMKGNVPIRSQTQKPRAILVAAMDLERHQVLSPDAVQVAVMDPLRIPAGALDADWVPEDGWGRWRVTRPVRAGTPLDMSRLERRPDAERGQTVRLVARYGPVEVVAEAVLEQDARIGERVQVRVPGSEPVFARLVAPDRAEVDVQ